MRAEMEAKERKLKSSSTRNGQDLWSFARVLRIEEGGHVSITMSRSFSKLASFKVDELQEQKQKKTLSHAVLCFVSSIILWVIHLDTVTV